MLRLGCDTASQAVEPAVSRRPRRAAWRRPQAVRSARRPRRPCRSCRTSPRCRTPSTSTAPPRAPPWPACARTPACRPGRRSRRPRAARRRSGRPGTAADLPGEPDEGCAARPVAHAHRMPPTVRPKLLVIAGVLVTPLVTAAMALAGNGGFAPVAPESPNAHAIKQSYLFISLFAFAIFLLVEGLLIAFVIRYRRKKRPREADGAQIHGA